MYVKILKPLLDRCLALMGLVVLSPVFLVLFILVRVKLGRPVFFVQERPGKDEKIFKLYKFRTMTDARDEKGRLLSDAVRLTRFGKFLRAASLDELPELFNILKGDMSFIGPRPLLVSYLPYYTEREKLRHTVRPGLTGLAQVSGRNFISWDERFALDVEYVEHISLRGDFILAVKTIQTIVGHKDQVAEDTNAVEGNFAEIRKALMDQDGNFL